MFVIRAKDRQTGKLMYLGVIPLDKTSPDNVITMFDTFEEASKYPFPTTEIAAATIGRLETQNWEYEAVPIAEAP